MRKLAVLLSLLLISIGCAKRVTVHPGAISNLDSYAYDVLLVEQASLDEARADYKAGKLPDSAIPVFNKVVAQYNIAQAAWHAYHEQHADNATALQDALNALVAAAGELQRALGKTSVTTAPSSELNLPLMPIKPQQLIYGGAI